MKYIVTMRFHPGQKAAALAAFERHGPHQSLGFNFLDAWVAATADVAFVLCESTDEAAVLLACQAWSAKGDFEYHHVQQAKIVQY